MTCEESFCCNDSNRNEWGTNRVLSRIAGEVSDEECLEVAGLDGPAKSRVAYYLLKMEAEY